jgi:diacylglycerol kinase family enzyme
VHSALLIWNPASGGGRRFGDRIPEIRSLLAAGGFAVTAAPTAEPGHATALAAEACRPGGCDVVFGMGGDGTLREIAVGLLGSSIPLAILPGGTANVLALALSVPAHPVRAAALYRAAELESRAFDVGVAGGIPFLMMVSAGVDSAILRRASQRAKERFGRLAVAAQAPAAMREHGSPTYTLVAGERRVAGTFVVASNIRYYGGRFEITPRADPFDGRLDFAVFAGSGPWSILGFALDVAAGAHLSRADLTVWQGTSARIEGAGEVWLQIDGDPIRLALPIQIGLAPHRLRILLPSTDGRVDRSRPLNPPA